MKFILLFIVCYFTNLMEVYHIQGCLKEQRTQKWWEDGLNKLHGCTNIREKNPSAWKYEKNYFSTHLNLFHYYKLHSCLCNG